MKKRITSIIAWVLVAVMFVLITPSLMTRLETEKLNKNVTVSVLYNDLVKKVSKTKFVENLDGYKNAGIDTISVMEEDLNALVATGEITCIKYNVLLHKFDDESLYLGEVIKDVYPDVTYDSYVVIVKRDRMKEQLAYLLPRRFTEKDYAFIGNVKYSEETDDMDVYIFHDGNKQLWDFALGYDEEEIEKLHSLGFKIALIHKVKNYQKTDYLEDIDKLVKKYDIEFLNLKEDTLPNKGKLNKKNYKGIADIINKNNMTLVVTENVNQLSNQKFFGYQEVFDSVMKKGGSEKVVRAYETYDESQADDSKYKYRVTQFFNSTMDRNLRFITVTQINLPNLTLPELADYSLRAATEYKAKIEAEGFTVNNPPASFRYDVRKTFNYGCCAVIMVLSCLIMLKLVFGKEFTKFSLLAIGVSLLSFAATMLLPVRFAFLLTLYPTLYCVVMSCFAMTLVLWFYKTAKDKMNVFTLALSGLGIILASLFVMSFGMGSMLSGIDYYINNDIFRGIKLSLLVPVFYTAVIYYIMFMKKENSNLLSDIFKILNADIKVFWVIIGSAILGIGAYYIIRSGNVESISGIEQTMRNTLTELFSARPRTKEFLIGYPALILLAYYIKKTDIKLIQWLLAIAASILAASVTNSFCHVFTDYSVIVSRTINGLIVGAFVCFAAIVANMIIVKLAKTISTKLNSFSEMN